jgi:hypothetical protein
LVSWKQDGQWTKPVMPAQETFNQYETSFNPYFLNKHRFERALYQSAARKNKNEARLLKSIEWNRLKKYVINEVIPPATDSVAIDVLLERPYKKDSTVISQRFAVTR